MLNGQEPDFTNYAKIQEQPVFQETLDYIFCSKEWEVKAVEELPHRSVAPAGPYPAENEPSDHVLLAAEVSLAK